MLNSIYKGIQWLLAIVGIVAIFVIGAYFYTFHGDLSRSSGDWADFGSLLAGVFTLCSALATIATFLVIHKENSDNKKIIQQQGEALAFEQYLKHRELFIQVVSETVANFPRKVELYNPDALYKKIFHQNNPTVVPAYKVNICNGEDCLPGDLSDIVKSYMSLIDQIINNDLKCVCSLHFILDRFFISCKEKPCVGDLVFEGRNTGINIYSFGEQVRGVFQLINTLLYFTGNAQVENLNRYADSTELRLGLIKEFFNKGAPRDRLYAQKSDGLIKVLEEIYIYSLDNGNFRSLFRWSSNCIQENFSGRIEVTKCLGHVEGFIDCLKREYRDLLDNRDNLSQENKYCLKKALYFINELDSMLSR